MTAQARFGAIGDGCVIDRPGPFLWNAQRVRLGDRVRIGREARLQMNQVDGRLNAWIDLGNGVVLGAGCQLSASVGITIGAGTRVEDEVLILDNFHSYEDITRPVHQQPIRLSGRVRIGSGAYIGRGAVILGGVTIGDGAVVVDRAVVRKDVAPGEWAVGSPAVRLVLTPS